MAGGFTGHDFLSSTEIYEAGKWTEVGPLFAAVNDALLAGLGPISAVAGVRGASVQNTVYMIGKRSLMITDMLLIC